MLFKLINGKKIPIEETYINDFPAPSSHVSTFKKFEDKRISFADIQWGADTDRPIVKGWRKVKNKKLKFQGVNYTHDDFDKIEGMWVLVSFSEDQPSVYFSKLEIINAHCAC